MSREANTFSAVDEKAWFIQAADDSRFFTQYNNFYYFLMWREYTICLIRERS